MSNCKVDDSVKKEINQMYHIDGTTKGNIMRKLGLTRPTVNKYIDPDYLEKNVEKVNGKWCVVHGHAQKPGSARDKPIGTPIHCYPGTDEGRKRAYAMHYAITQNQNKKGDEEMVDNKKLEKDERPPKKWWDACVSRAESFSTDPQAFCGALYYHRPASFEGKKPASMREAFGKACADMKLNPSFKDSEDFINKMELAEVKKESIETVLSQIVDFDKVKKETQRKALAKLLGLDKAETNAVSRDSGYQDPKFDNEKKKKPKSELECKMEELQKTLDDNSDQTTICTILDNVWNSLKGTETRTKPIIVKNDFLQGYKLCLLSDKHEIFNGLSSVTKTDDTHTFEDHLSKSFEDLGEVQPEDLIIGGYATSDDIDADGEVVEKEAAFDATSRWLQKDKYTNIMFMHSNLQVGDPVRSVKIGDKVHKTFQDDVGTYLVSKIRNDDDEEIQEVREGIRTKKLKAYSLGGRSIQKERICTARQCADHIKKLNIWEYTICEKGKNPRSGFEILHAPESWNN